MIAVNAARGLALFASSAVDRGLLAGLDLKDALDGELRRPGGKGARQTSQSRPQQQGGKSLELDDANAFPSLA